MPFEQASGLSELAQALCALLVLVAPLAAAGLALFNAGLGRSRSAAHAMLSSLAVLSVAFVAYSVCGFAWQGFSGGAALSSTIAGKRWSWIGAEPLFLRGLDRGGLGLTLAAWSQMVSVGIAALIPLGAGHDRWRLGPSCASTALLAGCTYPLFAHWAWGGGWLAQLGVNCGFGYGFVDVGGAGVIQTTGGLTALAVALILGPRRGKYTAEGLPAAIPGHNAVMILFACFLTWTGWLGLNGSGALLFGGAAPASLPLVALNTTLSAAMGALATAVNTRIRFGRPDASLCANGWTGGLVASSAGCCLLSPFGAAICGAIAGVLVAFSVEWLDARFGVDDPAGSISVHGVGGIWGLLSLPLLAHFPPAGALHGIGAGHGYAGQWLAQLAGVGALVAIILPIAYAFNRLIDRVLPQRVSPEAEIHGVDLHELGAGAYPEFVIHREDLRLR